MVHKINTMQKLIAFQFSNKKFTVNLGFSFQFNFDFAFDGNLMLGRVLVCDVHFGKNHHTDSTLDLVLDLGCLTVHLRCESDLHQTSDASWCGPHICRTVVDL